MTSSTCFGKRSCYGELELERACRKARKKKVWGTSEQNIIGSISVDLRLVNSGEVEGGDSGERGEDTDEEETESGAESPDGDASKFF